MAWLFSAAGILLQLEQSARVRLPVFPFSDCVRQGNRMVGDGSD
jgi:hypothetical protein